MSRSKGQRSERNLVQDLKRYGIEALRVPLSGMQQGFKGDVIATLENGLKVNFEVKSRRNSYGSLYTLYWANLAKNKEDVMYIAIPGSSAHLCVRISTSPFGIMEPNMGTYMVSSRHNLYEEHKKAFRRLETLSKLQATSDVLVLKDNNKPFLYLRYI